MVEKDPQIHTQFHQTMIRSLSQKGGRGNCLTGAIPVEECTVYGLGSSLLVQIQDVEMYTARGTRPFVGQNCV
uniref:Uncharacterized protein n=1 Tax=Arundo donax TaxID=35708 RepID=A0A0A9GA75_ARUDO